MWCVKLSDSQRDALIALVKTQCEPGPAVTAVLEALDAGALGRPPRGHAAVGQGRRAGRAQGIGEADVVWDLAAGMPSKARRRPAAGPPPASTP